MTSALARDWALDVATYTAGTLPTDPSISWVRFRGINDFNPAITPTLQDVTDYDVDGWSDSEKTMNAWVVTATARRPFDGGVYDPGQEIVRTTVDKFGDSARVFARWYEKNGGPEAHAGVAIPTWARSKTAVADVAAVTATLTGSGKQYTIVNPYTPAVAAGIATATPSGAAAGALVVLTGSGFAGATAVKFGATAAAAFEVISDSLIVATLPAGAAGTVAITVTTPTGTSPAFEYTRA